MLGTDNTLRSGHMLLLLLVASSILLGISYMNEMYQRIQLQTDLAIVERQTQRSITEKSIIQHKAAQLELKLEGAVQERKRLEDMHEFQSRQQNTNFEREKKDLLETISLKEEKIAELKDQYESLKLRFDSLHSVMEQVEKNQSRLLEKFATQSTQCMNVIGMMGKLCSMGKNNIQKILPFIKEKNTFTTALTSQSPDVTSKLKNISEALSLEGGFTKAQTPLMPAITDISLSSSDAKQRHLTVGPGVNNVSSEPENTTSPQKDQRNALAPKNTLQGRYLNVTTQEKKTSNAEKMLLTQQNDNFPKVNLNEKLIKNDVNENSTSRQRTKEKVLSDSRISYGNPFKDVSYYKRFSEIKRNALKNLRLQLANSSDLTIRGAQINVTQSDGEEKRNLTSSEDRTPETITRKKATEETPKVSLENELSSLLDVYNTEEKDKDGDIIKEEIKDEETHLADTSKKNSEKLQTRRIQYIDQ
ncbi:uncharacterized protein LOC143963150 isoform X1 [Lithobates pipiens]